MKNYKFLVPIVMVVLFTASIYMLYSTKSAEVNQYNQYLNDARSCRELGILTDAEDNYKKALEIKPSIELSVELGEFYWESAQTRSAINWGNDVIVKYPKDVSGYEFLMNIYIQRKDYIACFDLNEKMQKRKLTSESITSQLSEIEYEFFFNCEFSDVGIYSGGLCPVQVGNKWGYVNLTGDNVIAAQFTKAGYFSGDLAPVVTADGDAYFIDTKGNKKQVVQGVENIRELGLIENGIFSVFDGKTWGFYNSDSQHLFGEYASSSSIGNGIAAVKTGNKWSLVNRDGNAVSDTTYDGVVSDEKNVVFRNERLFVYDDLSYYLIDSDGNKISDNKYEDARVFNDTTFAAVKTGNKWGFIDKDGNVVIEAQFEDARSFSNGLAAVQMTGKWGFIDTTGKMVIAPQFDDAKDFNNKGCVFVKVDDTWKLLRLYKYNY